MSDLNVANKVNRLPAGLSGIAGEYFAAAELSRRGYTASLTLKNTRGIDILASNADATRSVGIQVKTSQGKAAKWLINNKVEAELGETEASIASNLVFIFIRLNGLDMPAYHIVPKEDVARFSKENHAIWLPKKSKSGKPHKDTNLREFRDESHKYLDKWDLLGL